MAKLKQPRNAAVFDVSKLDVHYFDFTYIDTTYIDVIYIDSLGGQHSVPLAITPAAFC
ncbi:hypothetical protein GCM10025791_15660 [Halioxenophilus aromaticivorans]|uniref:Uncharacterized protein n=1 Tax=Halioxenophilus aromaticivorans TaxID=1306992 RepID=A0AAV3U142_9ALTE